MKLIGNTIFITGGGTGIGRGLAEALHNLGNKVIIGGRRKAQLDEVVAANPGIEAIEVDVADPASISAVAKTLIADYPRLNTLINNAGIMIMDDAAGVIDENVMTSEISVNLMGSIRMSSALVDHLKSQPSSTIIYNSSILAFTPIAMFSVYCATKAALHSYAMSQRFMLRDSSVKVQEIAPPWVGTGLVGAVDDPRAVPLPRFIAGTIAALGTDAEEVLIEEAQISRNNVGPGEHVFVNQLNTMMVQAFAQAA